MHSVSIDNWASLYRAAGPRGVVAKTREMMGLHPSQETNFHIGPNGRPALKDIPNRIRPEQVSLKAVGIGIFEGAYPGRGWRVWERMMDPTRHISAATFEDVAGIDPTVFANINTYLGTIGGLIEVKVLERYEHATLAAMELVTVEPSKVMGQRKRIGVAQGGPEAKRRLPSEQHPRAKLGQRWVKVPETQETALGLDLTREAAFSDLTGELMEQAASIGEWIGYQVALDIYNMVLGVTNPYYFNDTNYNTYQTSSTSTDNNNYTNSLVNPITDPLTMMEKSNAAKMLLLEPPPPAGTGTRINVTFDTIFASPARADRLASILSADTLQIESAVPTGTAAGIRSFGKNPYVTQKVVTDAVAWQRVTDSDGLNLSGDTANGLWFRINKARAFGYSENWPLNVVTAPTDSYIMLDQGIVGTWFADQRGVPFVKDPRFAQKNTNS